MNSTIVTTSASCLASYFITAPSSSSPSSASTLLSTSIPTIQITLALTNFSASHFANATTSWALFTALLNTNIITLLLLPLVIREIPTFMTTTLDPLLDYVLDPWSWSYFPMWCAEVWRLVREEREARHYWVSASAGTAAAAVGSVERVWREKGVVEEITLRVGGRV